ncbi:hypothetical protein ACS0TY_025052 [Phlomoides rotata]
MPEARDRISRHEDIFASYINRRRMLSSRNSESFVLQDVADEQATGTPVRWRDTPMVGTPGLIRVPFGRGSFGSPRFGGSSNFGRSSRLIRGRENMSPALGSGRARRVLPGRGSILPYWYPRKPLQDVTAVVKAFERRRGRLGEGEGLQTESPILQDRSVHNPSGSTSVAQLEQDFSMISPHPTIELKRCPPTIGKVPKILLNVTNQHYGDSPCLTPQEKLLNNIDTVEKVVMEELRKLKRTPSAKKAEREKKVRTLMSMR